MAATNQVSCDLSGETVILNLQDSVYYGVNDVAARIWSLIQQPRAVGEIRQSLIEEYDVEPGACEAQLNDFLDTLAARGLIKVGA